MANAPLPPDTIIDGKNIFPVLVQNGTSPHDFIFMYNKLSGQNASVYAIRHGPYKVIFLSSSTAGSESMKQAHYTTSTSCDDNPPVHHYPPLLYNIDRDPSEKYPLDAKDNKDVKLF